MVFKLIERNEHLILLIFRVLVGLLFFEHGAQKLFGWFAQDNGHVPYLSLFGLAGAIEFFGGLALAAGFLTRYVACVAALEMLMAFRLAHLPRSWIPVKTGGDLPLLYFSCFLILIWKGAGRYGIDAKLFREGISHEEPCDNSGEKR